MMADYSLTSTGMIVRTADGAFIPPDSSNADHQAYVRWLGEGNTADPAEPPVPAIVAAALALLAGPVQVVSASVPAIDGAYPIDTATQMQITGIAAAIDAGFGLPSQAETFNWPDAANTARAWPAAQFSAFAKALMIFLYQAAQVAQGHSQTLPSATLALP